MTARERYLAPGGGYTYSPGRGLRGAGAALDEDEMKARARAGRKSDCVREREDRDRLVQQTQEAVDKLRVIGESLVEPSLRLASRRDARNHLRRAVHGAQSLIAVLEVEPWNQCDDGDE
jgi:hypothetical protein